MTPRPPMKNRVVRVSDKLWDAAMAKATREEVNLSDVIRRALEEYVEDEG